MQTQQNRNLIVDNDTDEAAQGIPIQEYFNMLRRRRLIIIQAFVVVAVAGTIVTLLTKPVYQATAQLLVDGQSFSINTVDQGNPLSGILALSEEQDVGTQVEELQAQPLIDHVVHDVGPNLTLSVDEVGSTNVIAVTAETNDAKSAAFAANDLLQTYISEDVDRNLGEIRNAESFAENQRQIAHQRLVVAEQQLSQFKQQNHVADLVSERSAEITNDVALGQQVQKEASGVSALQSQIAASNQLLAQEPQALQFSLPQSNPLKPSLQEQISALELQRVGMTQKGGFTAYAPQVISIDAQIASLTKQLKEQPNVTTTVSSEANGNREALKAGIETLKGQLAALQAQLTSDKTALTTSQAKLGKYAAWEVKLEDLQREHDTAESEDSMFASKVAELSLREQAHHASAHIIQTAEPPTVPIRPKKALSIFFSCLMGLFVGAGLALLQEFLDDRVNSVDEATRILGVPSLGQIPSIDEDGPHLLSQMSGLGSAAESYRVLRTNIHFAAIDAPVSTLLVTSAGPGEGKTTTAVNIAFAMALDGKRIILVDTDLRRPSIHKILEVPSLPGLTDVLLGHSTLMEALQVHKDFPNLLVLPAGSTPPNPGELLNSRRFHTIVDELREQADNVIFDSAPVLVAADSAILASQMDGTLFVIEGGSTKKGAAKRAIEILQHARSTILGVAYNKLSSGMNEGYSYYNYNYYALPDVDGKDSPNGTSGRRLSRDLSKPKVLNTTVLEDDEK